MLLTIKFDIKLLPDNKYLSMNFPDIPVFSILNNPYENGEVIVGTELGVWRTSNFFLPNPNWSQSYNGMSDVPVYDMDFRGESATDNRVVAASYGRGVYSGSFTSDTNPPVTVTDSITLAEGGTATTTRAGVRNVLYKDTDPEKASLKPYNYKLDIVYEDDDLLVINKSAGISMHPGAGNYDNTIVNALMNYCGGNLSTIGDELRPGIVHRIDKDTSGLIVIAKNNNAHENLSNQFKKHTIKRVYQVLIWGKLRPQSGKIETLILSLIHI